MNKIRSNLISKSPYRLSGLSALVLVVHMIRSYSLTEGKIKTFLTTNNVCGQSLENIFKANENNRLYLRLDIIDKAFFLQGGKQEKSLGTGLAGNNRINHCHGFLSIKYFICA